MHLGQVHLAMWSAKARFPRRTAHASSNNLPQPLLPSHRPLEYTHTAQRLSQSSLPSLSRFRTVFGIRLTVFSSSCPPSHILTSVAIVASCLLALMGHLPACAACIHDAFFTRCRQMLGTLRRLHMGQVHLGIRIRRSTISRGTGYD